MRHGKSIVFAGLVALCLTGGLATTSAATTGLNSIQQIANGTTLDFEGYPLHANPSVALAPYGITSDSFDLTEFLPGVTGNADAPIHSGAVFSPTIFGTTTPWHTVGFATISSLVGPSSSFSFSAFDQQHNLIYTDAHLFAPQIDPQDLVASNPSYNAAAFFFGVASDTPIYSLALSSSNQNYAIDSFTFVSVPEPAATATFLLLTPALYLRRRRGAR